MNSRMIMLAAAAPMALTVGMLVPDAVVAAETATARPVPKIRIPTSPAQIENTPRIRPPVTEAEEEAPAPEDEAVKVDAAEAAPTRRIRIGNNMPRIDTSTPVEVENQPRIRIATPVEAEPATEETAPRIRTRVGTPRIDTSAPAEIENKPRVRTRVATPSDDDVSPEDAPSTPRARDPIRRLPTQIDNSDPDSTPKPMPPQRIPSTPPRTRTAASDGSPAIGPASYIGSNKAGAVILKPGTHQQIVSKLPATRALDFSSLAANPVMTLGGTMFDFKPMFDNPKSLQNVGKRLNAMPQLVEVLDSPTMSGLQLKQGLVVRTALSYRLKLGACTTAANQALLTNAGISCFTYRSQAAREAAFSTPGSVEYVENPGKRATALANARAQSQINAADIQKNVDSFRASLNDPTERAKLTDALGDVEITRLEKLDDTALAGELVNSHETDIEEVAFIPILEPVSQSDAWLLQAKKAMAEAQLKRLAAADAQLAGATEATSYEIGEFQYLAGFTLGSAHEWRQGIRTTISWCLVGCKKTYFAEVWAGFNYGFGMRFPMKFGGTYRYEPGAYAKGKAYLDTTLVTVNGNADDYRSAGLAEDKIFAGQEFVAQFGASAGVHANLPLIGGIGPFEFKPEIKLTDYLPAPFTGGNLTPPMPGPSGPAADLTLDQIDLLGERANLGIVAAKVHPAVLIELTSDGMGLAMKGTNGNALSAELNGGDKTVELPMDEGQISSFTVGEPKYNIGFALTPGLKARLSINLAVWGAHVDWPIWFPSATIQIPSGGVDFGCHEGTICSRSFNLSPDGAVSRFTQDLKKWGLDYDSYWLKRCFDEICTTSVKLKRFDTIELALSQATFFSQVDTKPVSVQLADAGKAAEKYVAASVSRKAQKSSDTSAAMSSVALAYYTPQCKDSQCVDNVAALATQMGPTAAEATKLDPSMDAQTINKMVNKEFGPKFVAEVDASKVRAQMKNAKSVQDQVDRAGGKTPKL